MPSCYFYRIFYLLLLLSLLLLLLLQYSVAANQIPLQSMPLLQQQTLSLKRIYVHDNNTTLHRYQRRPLASIQYQDTTYKIKPVIDHFLKPSKNSLEYLSSTQHSRTRWQTVPLAQTTMDSVWDLVPDVTDRQTVLMLAKMSYDSYTEIGGTDWYDLDKGWTANDTFGWDQDGLRGHVFSNDDDSLMVIAIKGTSGSLFNGEPTGEKDKLNDNILFSCCCARISRVWRPVCDCYQGNEYRCEASCLENNILNEELYYDHALTIYRDISDQYPNTNIFLTGHSLGGALAALVAQTYGAPAVSFEAPGEKLASKRLHLPQAPAGRTPVFHFGHTADPIFIGLCTGVSSSCWYGGFAMETRCHTGKACVWDTVNDNGWKVDIRTHRIGDVIEKILKNEEEFPLPRCMPEQDCVDCGLWEFVDERDNAFNGRNSNSCGM